MILAINTASDQVSIALYRSQNTMNKLCWQSYRTQSRELLPKIDKFLKKNKIKPSDLEAIGVSRGPGSYTGLRVGIAVANSVAWALNIPVIGVKDISSKMDSFAIAKKTAKIYHHSKTHKFSDGVVPIYLSAKTRFK